MKIVINNHSGGKIEVTDKPIVNVMGDVVHNKYGEGYRPDEAVDLEAEVVEEESEESDGNLCLASGSQTVADYSASVAKCFVHANDYVKEQVRIIVSEFYLGLDANLALIEIVLYDHGQLHKRNKHTDFVKALMAWGGLPIECETTIRRMANNIADKVRNLPRNGYEEWEDRYQNDKNTCVRIGQKLDTTMPYSR